MADPLGQVAAARRRRAMLLALIFYLLVSASVTAIGAIQLYHAETGTATTATITSCEDYAPGRAASGDVCTGTWVAGGPLGAGGNFVSGTVEGASDRDLGKTVSVRVSGGTAYLRSLSMPVFVLAFGVGLLVLIPALRLISRRRTAARRGAAYDPRARRTDGQHEQSRAMNVTSNPLADDYLRRLDAAASALPADQREELVSGVRDYLQEALRQTPAGDKAAVRNALEQLGTPEEAAAAAADAYRELPGQPVAVFSQINSLAVASLLLGVLWLGGIGAVLALVFGYRARNQIKNSEGRQTGSGLAAAGIIVGWIGITILVVILASAIVK